jgi:hypothetical protein
MSSPARPRRGGARKALAVLLLSGWTLLFNPEPNPLNAPRGDWEDVEEYDTAWLCEEGRREEAAERAEEAAKERPGHSPSTLDAMLRYRCEHSGRTDAYRRAPGSR